jgi:hypothetical protein
MLNEYGEAYYKYHEQASTAQEKILYNQDRLNKINEIWETIIDGK